MMRLLGFLLAFIFLVPLIRGILGLVGRAFTNFAMRPSQPVPGQPPRVPVGGVLRKDPVCGTYVSENLAIKRVVAGETYYYCSEECRQKHQV